MKKTKKEIMDEKDNSKPYSGKTANNTEGKPVKVGPEEFEEDQKMNIRMKPQPLGQDPKKKQKAGRNKK